MYSSLGNTIVHSSRLTSLPVGESRLHAYIGVSIELTSLRIATHSMHTKCLYKKKARIASSCSRSTRIVMSYFCMAQANRSTRDLELELNALHRCRKRSGNWTLESNSL